MLEKVYADRQLGILTLGIEPEFDGLHQEPRFQDLLKRIGLPPPAGASTPRGTAERRIPSEREGNRAARPTP